MIIFPINIQSSNILLEQRLILISIISRILYPKFIYDKNNNNNKNNKKSNRATILSYFGGLNNNNELSQLIGLILLPFRNLILSLSSTNNINNNNNNNNESIIISNNSDEDNLIIEEQINFLKEYTTNIQSFEIFLQNIRNNNKNNNKIFIIPLNIQINTLQLIEYLLLHERSTLISFLPLLCSVMFWMLKQADDRIKKIKSNSSRRGDDGNHHHDDDEDMTDNINKNGYEIRKELSDLRSIKQLIFSRMSIIIQVYPKQFTPVNRHTTSINTLSSSLYIYLQTYLELSMSTLLIMSQELTQHRSSLLDSILYLSLDRSLLPILIDPNYTFSNKLIPLLFHMLAAKNVVITIINGIFDFIEILLLIDEEKELLDKKAKRTNTQKVTVIKVIKHNNGQTIRQETTAEQKNDNNMSDVMTDGGDGHHHNENTDENIQEINYLSSLTQQMWTQHITIFLSSMYTYLSSYIEKQHNKIFPRLELSLLARVSRYVNDNNNANQMAELMIIFLKRCNDRKQYIRYELTQEQQQENNKIEENIIHIIQHLLPLLNQELTQTIVLLFAKQLYTTNDVLLRILICECLTIAAKIYSSSSSSSLVSVASFLSSLCAIIRTNRLDEIDYTARTTAYQVFMDRYIREWDESQLEIAIPCVMRDLMNDEFGVRSQAVSALTALITHLKAQQRNAERPPLIITGTIYTTMKQGKDSFSHTLSSSLAFIFE